MFLILLNLVLETIIQDVCNEIELNGKNVMLMYIDDIVILGNTENYVVKVTEKPIEFSHKINLVINKNKTTSSNK